MTNLINAYGALFGALFTAASVVAAVLVYRHQCNAQVFLEYTKRYSDIMESFPGSAREARLRLNGDPPPASNELSLAVLRYLNLCSEEFYLRKRRYLSNGVWSIWERELKRTLQSPLLKREWRALRLEFDSYPDFVIYVERSQSGKK